ncbi:uncharacterized protein C8R40DRAFT_1087143 [Lentinula edodes]|uniref:uncharacterized protein n=1 Tax=Lentinula edodes TaxID=5353 RepID=UPI001E8E7F33|nr:uncharacterized protein C8R40DRAFT_1087143 [Lentinula edodes]KAH7878815.1 hypothetical protein C8R40DRAFT_1087143 [Lentinula edodes]
MLDFPQSVAMFAPSSLHTVDVVDDVDRKFNATHLYYKPHAVQIIQLVECSPPARILSPESFASSSGASSSYCSEEESECSSYCSSVEPLAEKSSPAFVHDEPSSLSETYNIRMKRILAWREDFSSHLSTTMSDPTISSSLKRKMPVNSDDNDVISHTSKRSRSHSSRGEGRNRCSSLSALSCPACDASFDTHKDLRQHGYDARVGANEACLVAVDYAFE